MGGARKPAIGEFTFGTVLVFLRLVRKCNELHDMIIAGTTWLIFEIYFRL